MAFNIYGTLNRNAGRERSIVNVPQLNMPTRFFDISFKPNSRNTIIVTCDNGWTVSMRIHNASSRVEPSLKFDVRLTEFLQPCTVTMKRGNEYIIYNQTVISKR